MEKNLSEVRRDPMCLTHLCGFSLLAAVLAIGMTCSAAIANVSLLGVQYQEDEPFTEYLCYWHDKDYPTYCGVDLVGANAHVFIKNDGASAVTLDDVILEGYSLETVIKYKDYNGHPAYSIYFYWEDPPTAIFNAGEPVWYKMDPKTIPAGGVGQIIVRLRLVPTTNPIDINVDTSANTLATSIPIDNTQPQLASVSFSQDLRTVYMYWRRANGTAPTTIKMDGVDITSSCETVSDASGSFAISTYTRSTALTSMSYHVFQGIYADSKQALAGVRTWANPFVYGSWDAFPTSSTAQGEDWIETCDDRGINTLIHQSSSEGLNALLLTSAGRLHAANHNYGFINKFVDQFSCSTPRMWFLDDEPDLEEANMVSTDCGDNNKKLPCGSNPMGIMGLHWIAQGESLRNSYNTLTTINLDGTFKPHNWYAYGQLVDCLMVDLYYEKLAMWSYYEYFNRIPLYDTVHVKYATALAATRATEPNTAIMTTFSCQATPTGYDPWDWAPPETKRIEVYYMLAGGAKGIGYWWFKKNPSGSNGLGDDGLVAQDPALWKEIGLLGAEIKTLQPYLVTSHPIDLDVQGSTNVWVNGLGCGTDTLILFVVNDNYVCTEEISYTPQSNATVTVNLPTWMQSPTPTAFEVSASGLGNVTSQINGDQLQLSLGTLDVTRLIIVTTDSTLRSTIQQRYEDEVWPGVCNFATDHCVAQENPPTITQHPSNQEVQEGGSSQFTIIATGSNPMSYQWQKDQSDIFNGGDYSGCDTATLTIANVDSNDEANYRCIVTNAFGQATSNEAAFTLAPPGPPTIAQHPTDQYVLPDGVANFTVTAIGTPPISYQWQKNQSDLSNGGHYSGATTATLTVSNADTNDEANYRCVATNSYGSATSNSALLTVTLCTAVMQNGGFEEGFTSGVGNAWTSYVESGATGVFSEGTSSPPEGSSYQVVQVNLAEGVPNKHAGVYQTISGCTIGNSYTIAGSYRTDSQWNSVIVHVLVDTNGGTDFSSAEQTLATKTGNSTGTDPNSNVFTTFSGQVTATGTSMTIFLDVEMDDVASGHIGAFDNVMMVCNNLPPTITQHPSAQNVEPGSTAHFTVAATGEGTLTYQWQKNLSNLNNSGHYSGVMTTTLTISSADSSDEANYRCVVTNAYGSVNSNSAALTVTQDPAMLQNGGFEDGFTSGVGNNWTSYVQSGATGVFSEGTSSPPEGSSYQVIQVNLPAGDNKHAGVYQTISGCTIGNNYIIAGSYRTDSQWNSITVRVFVDTNGGTDWASAEQTVASKTGNSSGTDPNSHIFTTFSGEVTATGTSMTIFLDVEMDDVASGHIGAFDDITVAPYTLDVDFDDDGDVDMADFGDFQKCLAAVGEIPTGCENRDFNSDNAVDATDLDTFLSCISGADIPADPNCVN